MAKACILPLGFFSLLSSMSLVPILSFLCYGCISFVSDLCSRFAPAVSWVSFDCTSVYLGCASSVSQLRLGVSRAIFSI